MPERRAVRGGPQTPAVWHDKVDLALRGQHPPDFMQHVLGAVGKFQPVDDDARGGLSCTRCDEARRAKQAVEHEALVAKLAAEGRRLCPNRFCGIEGDCETCGDEGTVPL